MLDILREDWEETGEEVTHLISFMEKLRDKMRKAAAVPPKALLKAQKVQGQQYNKQVQAREFKLPLLPSMANKLTVRWQGPSKGWTLL